MTDKETLKLALDDLMVEYDMERTSFAKRVDEIFKQALAAPVQDSTCNNSLREQGKAYPRTCKKCKFGPCIALANLALDKKAENARELGLDYEPAPVQEPVGEVNRYGLDSHGRKWHGIHWYDPNVDVAHGTKLYTTPPAAQRQWVGLTQDEFRDFASTLDYGTGGLIRAIEAKLKEKNT
jgi:hypothetical protein